MSTLSDEELVTRCKAELPGNTRSYEMLVQRYMNRVYSIVYRIVCDREEAEDLSQEVFIKVYNGLKKFEQQASFSSWLFRIATNCALDAIDKKKRQPKTVGIARNNRTQTSSTEEEDPPLNQPSTFKSNLLWWSVYWQRYIESNGRMIHDLRRIIPITTRPC